jgi:IPT/TIG domain
MLTGCDRQHRVSSSQVRSGQTNNAAPTIASISPSSLNAGAAAQSITITGTGFTSGSVVSFNGTPLQTTYTGSTSLQAAVPAALLANGQTASFVGRWNLQHSKLPG